MAERYLVLMSLTHTSLVTYSIFYLKSVAVTKLERQGLRNPVFPIHPPSLNQSSEGETHHLSACYHADKPSETFSMATVSTPRALCSRCRTVLAVDALMSNTSN